jgi:hypothetical protein
MALTPKAAAASRLPLVLAPELVFATVSATLQHLGWRRDPDLTAPEPILPGEPELASWVRDGGAARVIYGFHPAIALRVLGFTGIAAERLRRQAAEHLPTLPAEEIPALLRSPEVERVLLGIHAARELRAVHLIAALGELRDHPDELVAREALAAVANLAADAAVLGSEWLREERRRRPGRSIIFEHTGDVRMRRQVLRWLVHERMEPNEHVLEILRSALEDRDWEVRATAMLTAGLLLARPLRSMVNRVELPDTRTPGVDRADRDLLLSARVAVLALLDGRIEETHLSPEAERERPAHAALARILLGDMPEPPNWVFLYLYSLTTPVPDDVPVPPQLPSVLEEREGNYLLPELGIEWVWVPPLAHWLGDDARFLPSSTSPIRRATPTRGFLMAREPLTRNQAAMLGAASGSAAPSGPEAYHRCPFGVAERLCQVLGERLGAEVRLPEADEWEMGVRGPDGRRFPWGNSWEREAPRLASPWGAAAAVGIVPQWTRTSDSSGLLLVCGGTRHLACAAREPMPTELMGAGVRPLLPV